MRRWLPFLGLTILIMPGIASSAASEAVLYVQVRNTKLRSEPKFFSAQTANLDYGSQLSPLSAAPSDKSWIKVKSGNTEGYVHVSAVTKRKIILNGQAVPSGKVDQSSIVLAGKGFNSQVEGKYRATSGLDFAVVDEVEKLGVDGAEEAAFVTQGKLNS